MVKQSPMTVNKNDYIRIPVWLFSVLLPLVIAAAVSYG